MRALVLSAVVLAASALSGCAAMNQQWHGNCEVQAKDVLYRSTDGNSYRTKRVTTTCGSFDVEDSLTAGVFSSWDLWEQLEVGHVYDIKSGGYRAGALNMFPRVLDVQKVG